MPGCLRKNCFLQTSDDIMNLLWYCSCSFDKGNKIIRLPPKNLEYDCLKTQMYLSFSFCHIKVQKKSKFSEIF